MLLVVNVVWLVDTYCLFPISGWASLLHQRDYFNLMQQYRNHQHYTKLLPLKLIYMADHYVYCVVGFINCGGAFVRRKLTLHGSADTG